MAANMCLALSAKKIRKFLSVHMTESRLFVFTSISILLFLINAVWKSMLQF
jgi:hypothetical protein